MDCKTSENDRETSTGASLNLVEQLTSDFNQSHVNLQNTTNRYLADVKSSLGSIQKESTGYSKALLYAVEELNSESKAVRQALLEEGRSIRAAIYKQDRARRIEFAIQNTALASDFRYRVVKGSNSHEVYNGRDLMKTILLWFHKEHGYFVSDYILDGAYMSLTKEVKEEWKKKFQDKVSEELHLLLGVKPGFQVQTDGRVLIYYPAGKLSSTCA